MKKGFLSGNQLKFAALLFMTIDHIGVQIFPENEFLRILGRLALPIFAFLIAEGCKYTKNKKKYLGTILFTALVCQTVYFFALGSLYQCILVTFSLSIIINYLIDSAMKKRDALSIVSVVLALFAVYGLTEIVPLQLEGTDFAIDYGFFGVMLPVLVFVAKSDYLKIPALAVGLCFLAYKSGGIQWYSLYALILLLAYNGKRGKYNLKYLFYIYYPLHLVVIYAISLFV